LISVKAYTNNVLDYHVITDLLPQIARNAFLNKLIDTNNDASMTVVLSLVQKAILLGMGLQYKEIDAIASELELPVSQLLGLFLRTMKKICDFYINLKTNAIQESMKPNRVPSTEKENAKGHRDILEEGEWQPTEQSFEDDLDEASKEKMLEYRKKQREIIDGMDLSLYSFHLLTDIFTGNLGMKLEEPKKTGKKHLKSPK
jgi:N-acetyltransferase 10